MRSASNGMKKIGIILVGYKDYVNRYLNECRDSLRAQNYPKESYQVYIIDNCSINNCEYVKKNYPEAKCVSRPDGNYAAANNLGIKMAEEDGCEYFVIANMDVKFDVNWLSELVKAIDENPPNPLYQGGDKIGIAQSKILKYPLNEEEWKKPKINSLGNIIHFLGFGFTSGYNEVENTLNNSTDGINFASKGFLSASRRIRNDKTGEYPEIKGYASGCSLIIKKEVLDKIGGYNEDYYMYHDDLELGWKARLAGYKIVLAPRSVVYHKYEFSRSVQMLYYMERNRYLAFFTYYRCPTIMLLLPALAVMDAGMWFYSIVNGWFFTKLKISGYFLNPLTWVKIMRERRMVKKMRTKKDCEIIGGFAGQVLFQEIDNPVLKHIANPIFNLYWKIVFKVIKFIEL